MLGSSRIYLLHSLGQTSRIELMQPRGTATQPHPSPLAQVTQLLQRYEHFGIDLGLERVQRLLHNLGSPHLQVPVVHVAGTNGKGSVCAYLSAVLTAAGYRVGRYTSPHLVDWTERICLNEQAIAPTRLLWALEQVETAIAPDEPTPTQFEVITAAAWLIFATTPVDIAVVEVGLGGRLDATNVCDRPLASVITSISRDHWQRLGPTLADIAGEKAGILKPHCPAIIGPLPPEVIPVVQQRLLDLDCPAIWPKPAEPIAPPDPAVGAWAMAADIAYPLPLLGAVQLTNSALAIAALKVLQSQGWSIPETAIQIGMAQTRWPGRLQWTQWQGHDLLVDGAHNEGAAQFLRRYLDQHQLGPVQWLMGMLSTKDHTAIFQALLRPGDRLVLVPVPGHSAADTAHLAQLAQTLCPGLADCQQQPTLKKGLGALYTAPQASQTAMTAVLCGSLYLVGEFLREVAPPLIDPNSGLG